MFWPKVNLKPVAPVTMLSYSNSGKYSEMVSLRLSHLT
ncbi:MAG: hypothetical protein ACI83N_000764 [Hydrogenophaga sp.]|jgi:hypothetical protein